MRLDHLLSKGMSRGCFAVQLLRLEEQEKQQVLLHVLESVRFLGHARSAGRKIKTCLGKQAFHAVLIFSSVKLNTWILVAMRSGETPVHIPNTMVKTWPADGTLLETAWESRWLPDLEKDPGKRVDHIKRIIALSSDLNAEKLLYPDGCSSQGAG